MKRLFALLLFSLASGLASGATNCLASGDFTTGQQVLYLGSETWLVNVHYRLFVLRKDRISAVLKHPEQFLWLTCGVNNRPIAFSSEGSVYTFENDALALLASNIPKYVRFADGKTAYSAVELAQSGTDYAVYATTNGKTREIARGRYSARAADNHFYLKGPGGFSIFEDGKPVSSVRYPKNATGINLLWNGGQAACRQGQDGIYTGKEDDNYIVRSRFGEQTVVIHGAMHQVETRRHCSEYVLSQTTETGAGLWSLTPGKPLDFHLIPTACDVNSFSLNEDGAIHYRCDTEFHYLDASRKKDTRIGQASPLFENNLGDRWLVTPDYGTLYANTTRPGPGKPAPRICFARLLRDQMIQIGCAEAEP